MIYYIECDTENNVVHAACDPYATIVPLVNRITFSDPTTKLPLTNTAGAALSNYGFPMTDPVGITAAVYATIQAGGGAPFFTYDATTQTVVVKVANVKAA